MYLWDLSQEGDLQLARSDFLSDCRHQEPVTALCWAYSPSEARKKGLKPAATGREAAACYRLFSLGLDGQLLMWKGMELSSPMYG